MAQHIQRQDLRDLLWKVRNVDKHPEVAADQIIDFIEKNYDIKPTPKISNIERNFMEEEIQEMENDHYDDLGI